MSERERPPLRPNELPPDLASFLRDQRYACLMHATNLGTVFVVKAPAEDIESLRGKIPVEVSHELHSHPKGPVIRTIIRWHDQPGWPLAIETFTNIADEQQRADFIDLARRNELRFLFYDAALQHRLSKTVPNFQAGRIVRLAAAAAALGANIPQEDFDFDQAKAGIIANTSL